VKLPEVNSSNDSGLRGASACSRRRRRTSGATVVIAIRSPLDLSGSRGGIAVAGEEAEVEQMVKGASVLRTKGEAPATGKLPSTRCAKRVSYTDYSSRRSSFLNEAPPPSEQADAELLSLASAWAEKCKEFNVTGQIKAHLSPVRWYHL